MKTARDQRTHGHAIERGYKRIGGQWTSAGGTANQLVPAEAKDRPDDGADEEAQDHGEHLSGCDVF